MNNFKRELNDFAFGNSGMPGIGGEEDDGGSARKRKRKSRWATEEDDKTFIPGMPTVLPAGLEKDQEELYLLQLQIEEISRRLRTGDLGIASNPEERSPSPEPIYNNEGKRLNTREYRTRKKLEEQRHELIQKCCSLNDEYKPPSDYKPPVIKVTDKVMIPQEEHPDINFVGLLIGPRGNTLKNLEKDTGAKIIIRGKGSVKEGKIGRKDGQPLPGEDEPLHAYITANNPEFVKKAAIKIRDIIKQGIEVPEQQNDLRRQQLRELALLNGTLRENDGLMKLKQLQQAQTIITNNILCAKCGGTGHLTQDCKQARPSDTLRHTMNQNSGGQSGPLVPGLGAPGGFHVDKAKMDSEYSALMAELGEGPPSSKHKAPSGGMDGFNKPHFSSPPPGFGPPPHMQQYNSKQPPPSRPNFNQPPPSNNYQHQQHSRSPMNLPPPNMNQPPPSQQHHNIPPPPLGMSHPPSLMSSPPPLMSQHTQPPASGGRLPWANNNQRGGPPPPPGSSGQQGMPPTSSQSMPPPPLGAPPPPPPPSHNLPPWQQQQHNSYGLPPPPGPPPAPWHQQGPPPMSQHGGRPPWQQHNNSSNNGGPPPLMSQSVHPPPPPHMMPPPPPPGHQSFGGPPPPGTAPPPPPPGQGNDSGLPAGIPLGVPPPPPPT